MGQSRKDKQETRATPDTHDEDKQEKRATSDTQDEDTQSKQHNTILKQTQITQTRHHPSHTGGKDEPNITFIRKSHRTSQHGT